MTEPVTVRIVAEAGVNHDGNVERALELVTAAHAAGADAVKFQTFRADAVVTQSARLAGYQRANAGALKNQAALLRALELDHTAFRRIAKHCQRLGIQFLSTPFDSESLAFLVNDVGVAAIKLSSGDLTHAPLLLDAALTGKPLILSTGMATLDEIEEALGLVAYATLPAEMRPAPGRAAFRAAWADACARKAAQARVLLLQCTSQYPAPVAEANLNAMATLKARFGTNVGFSDHSEGIALPIAAAALGAAMIEKHFTLDRAASGPDHRASLDPSQLAAMVTAIRDVEAALGDGVKRPQPSEAETRVVARRSLVATRAVRKGEALTAETLAALRPADGRSPFDYWDVLGTETPKDLAAEEPIP